MPKYGFLAGIWVFVGWFEFIRFWGRETKINPLELISSGEDLSPTARVVGLAGVRSDLVGFFGWIGFSAGFGQP